MVIGRYQLSKIMIYSKYFFTVGAALLLSACSQNKLVRTSIDDISYATPLPESQSFDLESHIEYLPEIDINLDGQLPFKSYDYEFNGHKMTIELPENYTTFTFGDFKPRVFQSGGLSDSCKWRQGDCEGPGAGGWIHYAVQSAPRLCVIDTQYITESNSPSTCDGGMQFTPQKSAFTGLSYLDGFLKTHVNANDYDNKFVGDYHNFLVVEKNNDYRAATLISDQLAMVVSRVAKNTPDQNFIIDPIAYFDILQSMKVTEL